MAFSGPPSSNRSTLVTVRKTGWQYQKITSLSECGMYILSTMYWIIIYGTSLDSRNHTVKTVDQISWTKGSMNELEELDRGKTSNLCVAWKTDDKRWLWWWWWLCYRNFARKVIPQCWHLEAPNRQYQLFSPAFRVLINDLTNQYLSFFTGQPCYHTCIFPSSTIVLKSCSLEQWPHSADLLSVWDLQNSLPNNHIIIFLYVFFTAEASDMENHSSAEKQKLLQCLLDAVKQVDLLWIAFVCHQSRFFGTDFSKVDI